MIFGRDVLISESDVELANRLAAETGALLVQLRARLFDTGVPREVMDAGDAAAQRFIADELARLRPDDAVLSEEGLEDPRRFDATTASGSSTRSTARASSASAAVRTGPCTWHCGTTDAFWRPRSRAGARAHTVDRPTAHAADDRAAATRSSCPHARERRTRPMSPPHALGADVMLLGSAGAKAMAVVTGAADVYVHAGGMYQWDSAAPAAVALAAGLHVSRVDGSPLLYNERDPWLPDLVVCEPRFATTVLGALDHAFGFS